jgi:hypothetical protein
MIRLRLLPPLFLAVSTIAVASCTHPAENATKASALQFEQRWLDILQRHDAAALNCILATEFTDTSWKGSLRPREQVLGELTKRSSDYQQRLDEMSVQLLGNIAVVRGVNVITDQQNKPVARIRFTDVLQFSDKHWEAISAQETAEQ